MSYADSRGREGSHGAPFALSVTGGALCVGLGFFFVGLLDGSSFFDVPIIAQLSLLAFAIAIVIIGLAAGVIGLPLTLLFAHYRLERVWTYPLAGFVTGAVLVTFVPIVTGDLRGGSTFEYFPYAWIGALPGCVCGIIWWWTYRRHARTSGQKGA